MFLYARKLLAHWIYPPRPRKKLITHSTQNTCTVTHRDHAPLVWLNGSLQKRDIDFRFTDTFPGFIIMWYQPITEDSIVFVTCREG